jgi:hypothetical protein
LSKKQDGSLAYIDREILRIQHCLMLMDVMIARLRTLGDDVIQAVQTRRALGSELDRLRHERDVLLRR